MRFSYILLSFDAASPRCWIEEVLEEQDVRYTPIMGMVPRYSVEMPADKAVKFTKFCENLVGVTRVFKEDYDLNRPKRTYKNPQPAVRR